MSLKMNLRDKLDDDTLDLSMSELQEVPVREIASIRKATTLDLSNNRLASLPKTFVTLTQIVKLDLSKNMLTELPENFGELRQLKSLDLYSNQISRLPLSLGELKNLKWLDLKENPLTPAVASVAGLCSDAKECQACARNVVAYLAQVKQTIDEEKQRRINAIAAEPEREGAPAKKEGKKKKKRSEDKEIKAATEKRKSGMQKSDLLIGNGHLPSTMQIPESMHMTDRNSETDGAARKICRSLTSLIFWLIALGFLVSLALVTLPLFDKEKSETITNYMEVKTGQPVKQYQQLGTKSLEKLIDNVVLWTDDIQTRLWDIYSEYYGEKTIINSKREL